MNVRSKDLGGSPVTGDRKVKVRTVGVTGGRGSKKRGAGCKSPRTMPGTSDRKTVKQSGQQ